ncbi:prohibitin 1-like [Oscarella lobularis]|uniref:prohibitin 1-like n=1 Tax=Oscarella lobularis TaxID=121494 RepID=UPI003313D530
MTARFFNRLATFGVGLAITGGVVNSTLYTVPGGHRAVLFDRFRGVIPTPSGEGTHFLIPWVQRPIIYDCRATPRNVPVETGSKDLQTIAITLRILFRPKPEELPTIYQNLGQDYAERLLPSITTETLKAVVAQFDASELITQREIVSQKVRQLFTDRASKFGIITDDISITHLAFGKEFTHAVEQKQVAQQEAEKARFLVEKAEQHKRAAIITAEGDAKGAQLLSDAFKQAGEGLVELRRLEAAEEIASTLSRSPNVAYLPSGQNVLLSMPVGAR